MTNTSELSAPFITVIISAYSRRNYLESSIRSVLKQGLDRSKYEIIVSKNFEDPVIDEIIRKNNIIEVRTKNETYNNALLRSINIASGTIISFLEDDDLHRGEKLSRVYQEFESDVDLAFLHDNITYLVEEKDDKFKRIWRKVNSDLIVSVSNMTLKSLTSIHRHGTDAVISGVSIKKSFIVENSNLIKNMMLVDYLLPFLCLDQGGKVKHIGDILTTYRIHNSWTHALSLEINEKRSRRIDLLRQSIEDYDLMIDYITNTKITYVLGLIKNRMTVELTILQQGYNVDNFLKSNSDLIKLAVVQRSIKPFFLALANVFHKIFPNLIAQLFLFVTI